MSRRSICQLVRFGHGEPRFAGPAADHGAAPYHPFPGAPAGAAEIDLAAFGASPRGLGFNIRINLRGGLTALLALGFRLLEVIDTRPMQGEKAPPVAARADAQAIAARLRQRVQQAVRSGLRLLGAAFATGGGHINPVKVSESNWGAQGRGEVFTRRIERIAHVGRVNGKDEHEQARELEARQALDDAMEKKGEDDVEWENSGTRHEDTARGRCSAAGTFQGRMEPTLTRILIGTLPFRSRRNLLPIRGFLCENAKVSSATW